MGRSGRINAAPLLPAPDPGLGPMPNPPAPLPTHEARIRPRGHLEFERCRAGIRVRAIDNLTLIHRNSMRQTLCQHDLGSNSPNWHSEAHAIENGSGEDLLEMLEAGQAGHARYHLQCPPLNDRLGPEHLRPRSLPDRHVTAPPQEQSEVSAEEHSPGMTTGCDVQRYRPRDIPKPDAQPTRRGAAQYRMYQINETG